MKLKKVLLLVFGILIFVQSSYAVRVTKKNNHLKLDNNIIVFSYDLSSKTYSIYDKINAATLLRDCYARVGSTDLTDCKKTAKFKKRSVRDEIGRGVKVEFLCESQFEETYIFTVTVYEDKSFVALNAGIVNESDKPFRVHRIYPLYSGKAYQGSETKDVQMLNGEAGGGKSKIEKTDKMQSPNNMMVTFLSNGLRNSIVIGGLKYNDFAKWVSAEKTAEDGFELQIEYKDNVGMLVDSGSRYLPDDSCYVDVISDNPFDSLEQYGTSLKLANDANPNIYSFPTVCLWYASVPNWGGTDNEFLNNSVGAVKEMEHAVKSGFLKYSPVAVRLVPDLYENNCEQGWWDDEHWRKHDRYIEPYDTSEKWAGAILEMGGLPFTYFQTGLTSLDYVRMFPEHFLFNDVRFARKAEVQNPLIKNRNTQCTYDYTDPGFQRHLTKVWDNLENAGVKGVMFDYPETGWTTEGGFENDYATTTSAYRNIFKFAKQGLGSDSYVHERNVAGQPFLDVTAGIVDSQRVWVDTDLANAEMYTRCALRWYKTRKVFTYDTDSKNLFKVAPNNKDGLRQMLTMVYMVSGRLLLANSFKHITQEQVFEMSRVFPVHSTPITARPLDMLDGKEHPEVYDLPINYRWHQIAFFNTDLENESTISVDISRDSSFGGMGLDRNKKYHVYDFWNDKYLGVHKGSGKLEQKLRPGEVRMMSVHEVLNRPGFISTNRHVMQGYVELSDVKWDAEGKTLSGIADVIGGETFKIVIASNGFAPVSSESDQGKISLSAGNGEYFDVLIDNSENAKVEWSAFFKRL